MKLLRFLLIGILFGIILTKSEVISWFRIQEMFRFQNFHMYGVMGVAVTLGILMKFWMKKTGFKNINQQEVQFPDKPKNYIAAIGGGAMFGLGWAMTGACPGPLYVLAGHGYAVILVVIASALFGALAYGAFRSRLPH